MKKLTNIVKIALKEADKSEHNHKLGAVIFKHGKPIAKGYNKTNRGTSTNYGHWSGSLHAELSAIIHARTSLKGATLVVARRGGGLSRPCNHCLTAIQEAGIKKVFYTNGLGIESMRILK